MQWQLIVSLVVALLIIVFTFQNQHAVQMRFMGWQSGHIPVPITILISALCGAIASLALGIKQSRRLKKRIRRLESEMEDLTAPPLGDDDED